MKFKYETTKNAFAIKLIDDNSNADADAFWLCRRERPLAGVCFPLLGVFGFGKEKDRLAFKTQLIAERLADACMLEKECQLEVFEIDYPYDQVIGRLVAKEMEQDGKF